MTVIAMTREIGSFGLDVAAGLAARLGLEIIQSDTVANSIAERLGVDESAVLHYVNGSASLLERWQIDRRKLFHYAAEEILRIAQQGDVLIKGWGVATLLRDLPGVISVRVCAPVDFRVRVLMDRLGIKDANAVRVQIERYDAARARTMRAYFNIEREDARLYPIVLNTERLSIEACVKTVSELAESPRLQDTAAMRSTLANKLVEQLGIRRSHQPRRGAARRFRVGRRWHDYAFRHDEQRERAQAGREDRARYRGGLPDRQPDRQLAESRQRFLIRI
jgi:cytidylate kinase